MTALLEQTFIAAIWYALEQRRIRWNDAIQWDRAYAVLSTAGEL